MKHITTARSVQELVNTANTGELNPNPIGQRPPTSPGTSKSEGIIRTILSGLSVGQITLRDISEDTDAQKTYPGVKEVVIDGGHRIRALRDFFKGYFAVDGKTFLQLEDAQKELFLNTEISLCVYTCSAEQATLIFRILNTTTPTNQIEMIMSDDISPAAKAIRERTQFYKEYGNEVNELFEVITKSDGKRVSTYWSTDINPRRKWDEYVGILMLKAIGNGNVDAGLDTLGEYISSNEEPSKKAMSVVDDCLEDSVKVSKALKKKYNSKTFAAFQAVWFELLTLYGKFKISDYDAFAKDFYKVHSMLSGNIENKYDSDLRKFVTGKNKTELKTVKEFARNAVTNFANEYQQKAVAELYLGMMKLDKYMTELDTQRTVTRDKKYEMLAAQDYKCFIDGFPLDIDDAIFGHDTAWAEGGRIEEGKVIRHSHNVKMGTLSIADYRENFLMPRGEVAPELIS